jgi:peroxiredoxin
LTDWEGDVVRAFGVDRDVSGITGIPRRSAFLIENGETIVSAWMLGSELPDIDTVIAAATSHEAGF